MVEQVSELRQLAGEKGMLMQPQGKGSATTSAPGLCLGRAGLFSTRNGFITVDHKEKYLDGFRWKLGIATNPCVQYRKGRRCIYCGFLYHHDPVSPQNAGRVIRSILDSTDLQDINRLEIYVSGSFFDNDEVAAESRIEILESIQRTRIREILLESRPEFITEENLRSISDIVDARRVTIGIGVETMNDALRDALSKNFTTSELVRSMRVIAEAGMSFQAYLLLKPPAVISEQEAVLDLLSSSDSIIELSRRMRIPLILAVQPFFFARNSVVAESASFWDAKPPWLYSVALSLKLLTLLKAARYPDLRIILGNENDNVDPILASSNYRSDGTICSCTENLRRSLVEINTSQSTMNEATGRILDSQCDCKKIWEGLIGSGLR